MATTSQRSLRASASRASRRAKPAQSYKEWDSDSNEDIDGSDESSDTDVSEDIPLSYRPVRNASRPPAKRRKPSQPAPKLVTATHHQSPKERRSSTARHTPRRVSKRKQSFTSQRPVVIVPNLSSGIIPPWTTLPYQVLVQIFEYAATPLYDSKTFHATPSVRWLLDVCRLCKNFNEPALTVLYRCPPLIPMERAHKLVKLLTIEDQSLLAYNYRQKIEQLHIEVHQTAAYTLPGFGLLNLHDLVYNSPRLQDLQLCHLKDLPPYRELDIPIKWSYPDSLFDALDRNVDGRATTLLSWRWSARFAGKKIPVESLRTYHERPGFRSLQKCALVNYQIPRLKKDEEDPEHEAKLAESLAVLPDLQHLVLESSTLVNSIFMPLLPSSLRCLEIINCWELTSEDLASYLLTSGNQLTSLVLNHNQSLNISFLTVLAQACPHLTSVKMDLTCFSVHPSYAQTDPIYDRLMEADEKPTWPSTLQHIELLHLRKWDRPISENFFQSLLDSAAKLVDLRTIVVHANLSVSWRERATFRKEWIEPYTRVFRAPLTQPNPHLVSLRAWELHKAHSSFLEKDKDNRHNNTAADNAELNRINQENTRRPSKDVAESRTMSLRTRSRKGEPTTSVGPRVPVREVEILHRTAGYHSVGRQSTNGERITIDSDSDDQPLADQRKRREASQTPQFIQGKCTLVDIRIENHRPAETQFKEADFLDSEPEGDADWDGTDDLPGEEGYGW